MYSLVSAICKEKDSGYVYKSVDISNIPLVILYAKYLNIYATLYSNSLDKNIVFDVFSIINEYNQSALTLSDYLLANGENTLPETTDYPVLQNGKVKYANGFHADYEITPIYRGNSTGSTLPDSWKTWLKLNKKSVTSSEFHKYCMVSINGYFHLIDHDENNVYVIDGNRGRKICKDSKIGIYSFYELGSLTYIPIKESMINKANANIDLFSKTIIKLPTNIGNKTPILVIGGYMIVLDENIYNILSDTEILINFNDFQLLEKYYESLNYLNLDSLGLTAYAKNESLVDYSEFYSDAFIKSYLTLSQSFIVLVDNPCLHVNRIKLEKESFSNAYQTRMIPQLPMILGYGRVAEYWYKKNEKNYYLTVQNNAKQNFLFRTADPMEEISAIDSRYPYKITHLSDAYLLEIITTVKGNI